MIGCGPAASGNEIWRPPDRLGLESGMMVIVNGKPREMADQTLVEQLICDLGLAGQACAVEVNQRLVPKREHAGHTLREGDRVEVVTLIGGG